MGRLIGDCQMFKMSASIWSPSRFPTHNCKLLGWIQSSRMGTDRFLRRNSCGCCKTTTTLSLNCIRSDGKAEQIHACGVGRWQRVQIERFFDCFWLIVLQRARGCQSKKTKSQEIGRCRGLSVRRLLPYRTIESEEPTVVCPSKFRIFDECPVTSTWNTANTKYKHHSASFSFSKTKPLLNEERSGQ